MEDKKSLRRREGKKGERGRKENSEILLVSADTLASLLYVTRATAACRPDPSLEFVSRMKLGPKDSPAISAPQQSAPCLRPLLTLHYPIQKCVREIKYERMSLPHLFAHIHHGLTKLLYL